MRDERQSSARVVCPRRSTEKKKTYQDLILRDKLLQDKQTQSVKDPEVKKSVKLEHRLPSDPMDVGICGRGEIKVDDIGNILEVHTSGDSELFVLSPLKTSEIT